MYTVNRATARYITTAAVIAAIYTALSLLASGLGLANSVIQIRFSEMLCILPIFTSAAIPGLFVGCILSNILSGAVIWDIIFGSLATLIGALATRALRKLRVNSVPVFSFIPPIAANTIIIPFVLAYAYRIENALSFMMLTVGTGEVISVALLGGLLYCALRKYDSVLF